MRGTAPGEAVRQTRTSDRGTSTRVGLAVPSFSDNTTRGDAEDLTERRIREPETNRSTSAVKCAARACGTRSRSCRRCCGAIRA